MSEFDPAVDYVLRNEGKFVDDPKDPGGATNFGISLSFLRKINSNKLKEVGIYSYPDAQTIRNLTLGQAIKIYHDEFWLQHPFYRIESQDFADYLFDSVVNMGPKPAFVCLSRAIRAHSPVIVSEYDTMTEKIINAVNDCWSHILPALRSERAAHYRILALRNPVLTKFLNGWLNRAYRIDR